MEYAQLNINGTDAIQINTHGNVEWDENNFCSAEALTKDGKAEQFRVVPLSITEAPAFDPMTQSVIRDGCELVDGAWQYKWRIDTLDEEQIAVNLAASDAARIAALWQAAHDYEFAQVSGSAIGLLAIGGLQGLPKCIAVQNWIKSIWSVYYTRKAGTSTDTDFSIAGQCPHSVPELMVELGF